MLAIRHSLFETNSSAMHSIVYVDAINKDSSFDKRRYNAVKNVYTIKYLDPYDGDETGILTTPKEKIDYLMTHAGTQYTVKEITDMLNSKKDLNAETDVDLCTIEVVRAVVREQFKNCKFKIDYDLDDYAEIDAEAYDTVRSDFVDKNHLSTHESICSELRKVILDPNYFIILTRDGYPYFVYDHETNESYLDLPRGYIKESVIESDKVVIKNNYIYLGYASDDKYFGRIWGAEDLFGTISDMTINEFETIVINKLRKNYQGALDLINKDTAKEFFNYNHMNYTLGSLIKVWKLIYKYRDALDEEHKK